MAVLLVQEVAVKGLLRKQISAEAGISDLKIKIPAFAGMTYE